MPGAGMGTGTGAGMGAGVGAGMSAGTGAGMGIDSAGGILGCLVSRAWERKSVLGFSMIVVSDSVESWENHEHFQV
jgi:hypothetical protein